MAETEKPSEPAAPAPPVDGAPPTPPKRSPGHRGADVKDTVAEMAAKAHEISLEAGSKMAAAMKDVVNAAAGLSGFVIESARDLVQYMVRRGQMTQEEADKLIHQVEEHQPKRKAVVPPALLKSASAPQPVLSPKPASAPSHVPTHASSHPPVAHSTPVKAAHKPAAKPSKPAPKAKSAKPAKPAKPAKSSKSVSKKAAKPAPKKAAAKKSPAKKPPPKKAAKAKRR